MRVKLIYSRADWNEVLNACRTTVGKEGILKQPSERWRKNILLAEHSPIRKLQISVKCYDVKSWVATHYCRHHVGCEKYVQTQRTDRTGINRDELPQGALVTLEMDLNAQAIINISRKRLCMQASPETRELWKLILEEIKKELPELYDVCIPECIYRGFCPETDRCCGYVNSNGYKKQLEQYRKID
jgi:thymidylate synthase ThyX